MPRQGHIQRVKRIYGYVWHTKSGAIRVRTSEPDLTEYPDQVFDWAHTIYGEVTEVLPDKVPKPLGKEVVLTVYVDANLYHDLVTGRALTAVLHFINQTPFDWYSKKQGTVEDATFASEFNAARTAVNQIIENRIILRYFGVKIKGKTYLFGDNEAVITNSTIPHSQLNKRHLALAYHKVREAQAANVIGFYHIDGDKNPADIMSKIWGYQQVWPQLKAILFWQGDTKDISLIMVNHAKSQDSQISIHSCTSRIRGELQQYHLSNDQEIVRCLANATHVTSDIWILDVSGKFKND
jgi:hypothetical protein